MNFRKLEMTGRVSAIAFVAALGSWHTASAQSSDGAETEKKLGTVVVTATKRQESVQDVPIPITALSGDMLEESGVDTLQDMQFLSPSLSLPQGNNPNNSRIIIRGVGSVGNAAIEPSVATFIDGIYIARPGALLGDLQDVSVVEVIRGPQGTLFGRNATVGALNLRTNTPTDEFEGAATLSYGSYNAAEIGGVLNVPFSEKVAARFAANYSSRDGYGDNFRPGEEGEIGDRTSTSVRGKLRFDLAENLEVVLSADYSDVEIGGAVVEVLSSSTTAQNIARLSARTNGAVPDVTDTFDYNVNQRHLDENETEQTGVSLDVSYDIGDFTLKSITGYRDWSYDAVTDPFRLPLDIININEAFKTETLSQEFQVLSPRNGIFEYVAGFYYYNEDFDIDTQRDLQPGFCGTLIAIAAPPFQGPCTASPQTGAVVAAFEQEVESYALFGQATYFLSDQFSLTGGLRWTSDDKEGSFQSTTYNPIVAATQTASEPFRALEYSDDQITYLVTLNYRPSEDVLAYATFNTGYKSGGFNSNVSGSSPLSAEQRVFDSETVENIELGVKSTLLDGALIANVNLFRTEISDFQDRSFDGLGFVTRNAGGLRQQGVEFDFKSMTTNNLMLALNGVFLDSEFTSFTAAAALPGISGVQDLTGQSAHFSPEWSLSGVAEYTDSVPGAANLDWFARGEWSYAGEQNISGRTNQNPNTVRNALDLANFRVGISSDEGWRFTAYVENAFDEAYCQTNLEQVAAGSLGVRDGAGGTLLRCPLGAPRTWGVKLNYDF